MVRFKVDLTDEEFQSLVRLSGAELRTPREQLRFLLREELKRLGLLKDDSKEDEEKAKE
jgi:hypothetical protein